MQRADARLAVGAARVVAVRASASACFVIELQTITATSRGSGSQAMLQRARVEHQRVPRAAVARDELIHDAAARAGELVFRPLAGERQRGAIDRVPAWSSSA